MVSPLGEDILGVTDLADIADALDPTDELAEKIANASEKISCLAECLAEAHINAINPLPIGIDLSHPSSPSGLLSLEGWNPGGFFNAVGWGTGGLAQNISNNMMSEVLGSPGRSNPIPKPPPWMTADQYQQGMQGFARPEEFPRMTSHFNKAYYERWVRHLRKVAKGAPVAGTAISAYFLKGDIEDCFCKCMNNMSSIP